MKPSGRRALYRILTIPVVGYALLACWRSGWLPRPRRDALAVLKDGRRLQCRLADRTQRTMYFGLFEPSETRLLKELLKPGDTFIDVGAHIGWFTTAASGCVGEAGTVIAFEPYPANAAVLAGNLTRNRCANVRVVEAAVGSLNGGKVTLAAAGGDSGAVTALDWAHDGRVEVPVVTLDEFAAGLGSVALLKVDVEGWEAHVLKGAAQTLQRTGHVMIEINRTALRKAGSSPDEIAGLLRQAGFTGLVPVGERGLRRLRGGPVSNALAVRR
jgi:FkbM family methyltransferase